MSRRKTRTGAPACVMPLRTGMLQWCRRCYSTAPTSARFNRGCTSLHLASYGGHAAVVQTLLQHGADVAARDEDGCTSLHEASSGGFLLRILQASGHAAVVQTLLQHGADVAARDEDGRTSLHYASKNGHAAVVQTLLQHGADVAARDMGGKTPLDYAKHCNDEVKKEEVNAVFARHSLLLAAQVGIAELVP